jgi:5-hydroxyisourate hydrolase
VASRVIALQLFDDLYGSPAVDVAARLERSVEDGWQVAAGARTDSDGCIPEWSRLLPSRGLGRIVLETDAYFASLGIRAAYPFVAVAFRFAPDADRWRILITLSPFSYSAHYGFAESLEG